MKTRPSLLPRPDNKDFLDSVANQSAILSEPTCFLTEETVEELEDLSSPFAGTAKEMAMMLEAFPPTNEGNVLTPQDWMYIKKHSYNAFRLKCKKEGRLI
jgi:hypothetical protein